MTSHPPAGCSLETPSLDLDQPQVGDGATTPNFPLNPALPGLFHKLHNNFYIIWKSYLFFQVCRYQCHLQVRLVPTGAFLPNHGCIQFKYCGIYPIFYPACNCCCYDDYFYCIWCSIRHSPLALITPYVVA